MTRIPMICAAWLLAAGSAWAQAFPQKTVTLVVPYAPGGTTDLVARILAHELSISWAQPVMVENRPGAAGNLGARLVARSEPDGYTLLFTAAAPLTINKLLFANLPFDPEKDFAPIRVIATSPLVMMINPQTPARSVKELIEYAKTRPHRLSYGHSGIGTTSQLAAALFTSMAQVDLTAVPYKGSAPAMNALLGGEISLLFDTVPTAMQQVKAGKIVALAVATRVRTPAAPELPTIAEAGLPGYEVSTWFGLVAPAGTAPALVEKIDADVGQVLAKPAVAARLRDLGAEPGTVSTAAFGSFIKTETATFARIVKAAGAIPE